MRDPRRPPRTLLAVLTLLAPLLPMAGRRASGDTIQLKNGTIYRGSIDRDKPLIWIFDGLKRVVVRDSKVERIVSDASLRNLEVFKLEQPLVVHGGALPKEVIRVQASPWNDRGRREFAFEGSTLGKVTSMEQAIIEMGPHLVKIRGVNGFWQSQLSISQIPREIVLGILARVDPQDKNERIRVARFLIQAEWYTEARAALEKILGDFPGDSDLRERVRDALVSVVQSEAAQIKAAIDRCRLAQQPREASTLLKTFPSKDVPAELLSQVGELSRGDETRDAADKALASYLRALVYRLSTPTASKARKTEKTEAFEVLRKRPVLEVLRTLKEAPDSIRDRFVSWRKATADSSKSDEAQLALAISGYLVGAEAAVEDLELAATLWEMRETLRDYLASRSQETRAEHLARLEETNLPPEESRPIPLRKLETLTLLATRMRPPLHDDAASQPEDGPKIFRVQDDENAAPTEYSVALPPEYHPLRLYPAVVALHGGGGPRSALDWWSAEAAKRGYIVVAPEYGVPGQEKDYHYSASEHAAVELALRDARRRFAIDSDRVFVGGQLLGANMAWDFGLAHPDLFAGVVVVSGLPFKYVPRYLSHTERVPLYVVLGDLAPAANEVVFGEILKPQLLRAPDITYVEYLKRGLEDFPEEAPAVFDWMERRRRTPVPRAFDVLSARTSDNRFYGVVIREFQTGRTTSPEAVDPLGKNLSPATLKMKSSSLSNLLMLQSSGVKSLDVWVSPRLIDFKKRMEIRINGKPYFKGMAKPSIEPLLEDLRLRGDRQQTYWMKVSAG
ncbi:MAG: peptidase [Isosphaeraceae bacterium]